VAGIIVLSQYYPSHASYHRSLHSSPNVINENGNPSRYKHRIRDLHTNGEFTHLSQADGPSDHHRDNRSAHDKKDRLSQSSASTYKENGLMGFPPVQICGMVLNTSNDDDLDDDVTTPLHNNALPHSTTEDDTIIERRKLVDPRHRRYRHIRDNENIDEIHEQSSPLQPRRNGHTEASLLQIPCSLLLRTTTSGTTNPIPIATYLDTGAQVSVMTIKAAKRAGLAHLIDKRYAGRAVGVAGISCGVLGRISARTVSLVFGGCHNGDGSDSVVVDRSPAIFVLEEGIGANGDGVELLLGLDALEDWSAGICLRDRTLTIRSKNISKSATDGGTNGEENLVVSFVDTDGTSGKSSHTTKLPTRKANTRKANTHQHRGSSNLNTHDADPIQQKSVTKKRNISSPSTPWVVTSRRMPATDLESDLDLLDSTNSGACQHDTDKVTPEGLREKGGSWENDTLYCDDDYDDDEFSDADFDYDGCDLSGM